MNQSLKIIADNPNLFEALKEHLLSKFNRHDVLQDGKDDILLGQIFRARLEGSRLVEEALKEIARLQTSAKKPEAVNLAR